MGLLNPLYYVVSWILVQFHALFSLVLDPASGWAWVLSIMGLVVVIRIMLIPLFVKQIKAQRGLQILQPKIKEIQKRYKDDRQKQSEELMKLYRETGTNPFSSCLPIILQMPIFFALFHVLNYGVQRAEPVGAMTQDLVNQANAATWFGAKLSDTFMNADTPATRWLTVVMIVLMSGSTFLTQRQLMVKNMPSGQDNPLMQQQKILLYVFPFMFAVFGVNFPIGVLVYWLTTNIWSMGQQFYVIRRNPAPGSPAYDEMQARKAAKGEAQPAEPPDEPVEEAPEPPRPARQQPKRQPRSKRKNPQRAKPQKPRNPDDPDSTKEAS